MQDVTDAGLTVIIERDDICDNSDSESEDGHIRMYENHLREVDEQDDEVDELRQQLADKNKELHRAVSSLDELRRSLAAKETEVNQLRLQYIADLQQSSNRVDSVENQVQFQSAAFIARRGVTPVTMFRLIL